MRPAAPPVAHSLTPAAAATAPCREEVASSGGNSPRTGSSRRRQRLLPPSGGELRLQHLAGAAFSRAQPSSSSFSSSSAPPLPACLPAWLPSSGNSRHWGCVAGGSPSARAPAASVSRLTRRAVVGGAPQGGGWGRGSFSSRRSRGGAEGAGGRGPGERRPLAVAGGGAAAAGAGRAPGPRLPVAAELLCTESPRFPRS